MTIAQRWTYPHADRDDTAEELHGTVVTDPYRYLEDADGERTHAFVAAQNALSAPYLAGLASRERFGELTGALLAAPRAGVPWERGGRYFVISNPGGREQDILYTAASVDALLAEPQVLLDPNGLSKDGTVALTATSVSDDGSLLAYATSEAGSDWLTIRVRDVGDGAAAGADRDDVLRWCKWVSPTWLPDGQSFLYWRYPEPQPHDDATRGAARHAADGEVATGETNGEAAAETSGEAGTGSFAATFTAAMGVGELALHRLGTAQDADEVVWYRPDEPEWMATPWVSPDGGWLLLTAGPGTDSRTTVTARRLERDPNGRSTIGGDEVAVVGELADAHQVVGCDGDRLLLRTERAAPRGRLVQTDLADPAAPWREVVPQHENDVLVSAHLAASALVVVWSRDAAHHLEARRHDGSPWLTVQIAGPVAVTAVHSRPSSHQVFVGTSAFTRPVMAHRLDLFGTAMTLVDLPGPATLDTVTDVRRHDADEERRRGSVGAGVPVTSRRVLATSKDGNQVPMTVLSRTDLAGSGPRPTLLYGYGGFDIPVLPEFRAIFAAWVQAGGVLAVANLRGGGEFGARWHEAGMRACKQNVFDDAIACAEQLIADGTTTAKQLAVHGRSNGGLLVGAVMTQRPDLFGAALPTVGVLDMLRFHKFTIGWAWISDYGDPDDATDFAVLQAYSPLHALLEGTAYPPTLICTGDHDDRVVPAHSLKFGAQLQHCQAPGAGPVLLRIDTRAGHGAGKPAHAQAAEFADQLAFAAEHTGLVPSVPASSPIRATPRQP